MGIRMISANSDHTMRISPCYILFSYFLAPNHRSAQPNAPSDETAIYAETLLNAMKDLSILAPAAAATTSAGASTAARPQSAPAYRQLQSQLLMSLARKYAHGEELGLNSSQKAQGAAEADDAGSVVSAHTAKTTQSNQKVI